MVSSGGGGLRPNGELLLHNDLERDEGEGDVQEVALLTLEAWMRSVGAAVVGGGGELDRSASAGEDEDGGDLTNDGVPPRFLQRG